MPKPGQPIRQQLSPAEQARADFEDRNAWQVSARENRWRYWHELRLVVFRYRDDRFGWVIFEDGEDPLYSQIRYESIDEAIDDLGAWIGIGE